MKHTKAKYVVVAVATGSVALASMAGSCFADSGSSQIYLSSPATAIDFTVDQIYMTTTANSTDATVTDVTITNNLSSAPIYLTQIIATETGDYGITSYTDNYNTYAIDSKKFALAINSIDDIALGSPIDLSTLNIPNVKIDANGDLVFGLTGKASLSSTTLNQVQVGNLEVTVGPIPSPNPGDLVIDPPTECH